MGPRLTDLPRWSKTVRSAPYGHFANAVTTHGHPRAHVGALAHGAAIWEAFQRRNEKGNGPRSFLEAILHWLREWQPHRTETPEIDAAFVGGNRPKGRIPSRRTAGLQDLPYFIPLGEGLAQIARGEVGDDARGCSRSGHVCRLLTKLFRT